MHPATLIRERTNNALTTCRIMRLRTPSHIAKNPYSVFSTSYTLPLHSISFYLLCSHAITHSAHKKGGGGVPPFSKADVSCFLSQARSPFLQPICFQSFVQVPLLQAFSFQSFEQFKAGGGGDIQFQYQASCLSPLKVDLPTSRPPQNIRSPLCVHPQYLSEGV